MESDNYSTNATEDYYLYNASEFPDCHDITENELLIRSIWMYAGYPILALGTVGHLLVLVLLLLNEHLRSLPLSVLLITMSASGLMALYVGLMPKIVKHHTCYNMLLEDQTTETGCRLFKAAIYFSMQLYSWTEASVAVERMCAVRWSFACRKLSSRSVNKISLTCIIIVLMALNGIHFKIFGSSSGQCYVEDTKLFKVWNYVHSVVYIMFPVGVMLPANAVTLHTMYRSPMRNVGNVKKAKPVAIMMFILNGIFVVTTVPILVGDYEHLDASAYEGARVAWVVSQLMMYLGCSLTFLVYVAVAAKFRKAISELLVSGKKKICCATITMSNESADHNNAEGGKDYCVSPSDDSKTIQFVTSRTSSTTEGKS